MCFDSELKDRIAVVTGGSRGIGRAVSRRLAELGALVFVNYVSNEKAAQDVVDEITQKGGQASLLPFDVADKDASAESLKRVIKEHGAIHVMVNNAGITKDGLLARMKEGDWDKVMSVNLKGIYNCTQPILMAMMKQRWGRIINIGSVVGSMGNVGQCNYAAAKAGIEGFTKALAREVAPRGITANVVAPGFIETDMTAALPDKIKDQLLGQIPVGRLGSPEDVADAVAFLASGRASYITGHVLHVNGGLLCS